jgi:hypothetical protein
MIEPMHRIPVLKLEAVCGSNDKPPIRRLLALATLGPTTIDRSISKAAWKHWAIIAITWLAFLISFFLPATDVVEVDGVAPGTPLSGWQAFTASLSTFAAMFPWMMFAEPRCLLFLAFPLMNLLAFAALLFALLAPEEAECLGLVLVPLAAIPLLLPHILTGNLIIGFYLGIGSFIGMSLGGVWLSYATNEFPIIDNLERK